jgi:hypothetical protein
MGDMPQRKKLSTTIGPENYTYLRRLVTTGKARSVGAAVDKTIEIARKLESRAKLEHDTEAYFAQMTPETLAAEKALATAVSEASLEVDFDQP